MVLGVLEYIQCKYKDTDWKWHTSTTVEELFSSIPLNRLDLAGVVRQPRVALVSDSTQYTGGSI
jgi:hypothetical protein